MWTSLTRSCSGLTPGTKSSPKFFPVRAHQPDGRSGGLTAVVCMDRRIPFSAGVHVENEVDFAHNDRRVEGTRCYAVMARSDEPYG